MHHLARHSVACFLTRGDLYISWEEGQAVFEELLIDAVSGPTDKAMVCTLCQWCAWRIKGGLVSAGVVHGAVLPSAGCN